MEFADELPSPFRLGVGVNEDHAHGRRLWNHDVRSTIRWEVFLHARYFEMYPILGDRDCQVVLLSTVVQTDQAVLIFQNVQVLAERALNVVDYTFSQR